MTLFLKFKNYSHVHYAPTYVYNSIVKYNKETRLS